MNNPIYLSRRNPKVKCLTFSLPSKKTCPGSTAACRAICYAAATEAIYKETLPCRFRNLEATRRDDFVDLMVAKLSKARSRVLRVHEAGDFYNQAYVEKWAEIARRLPDFRFYAYTRSWMLDFSSILALANWNIRYSVDCTTIGWRDDMPKALAGSAYPGEDYVACPGSAGGDIKCVRDCRLCVDTDANIYFHVHGVHKMKIHQFEEVRKAA